MLRLYDFLKLAFGAAMAVTPLWSDVSQTATAVDVELVLAVDISGSMDRAKLEIQRQGYVNAFRQMEFSKTVKSGAIGKIAVVYMEWAGARYQKVLVPWTIIAGADDAGQFADRLAAEPYDQAPQPNRGTSISGALLSSAELFAKFGSSQARRVVDISGDGTNNSGMPLTFVRDTLVAQGITINGLPLAVESNPSINY
jgi:hypothetical protein